MMEIPGVLSRISFKNYGFGLLVENKNLPLMAQSEIIEIVRNYVRLLVSMGISIEKVFLYGSWARNDATGDSDIDVMLVSSSYEKKDDLLRAKTWRATEKIDLRIEPFMISQQKFMNDDISPILQMVKKEGIEIVL